MIRIVIADDHTIVREGLKQLLASARDLAVIGEARHHLRVPLRLHAAAHHAQGHHGLAFPGDECRDDGMERALARRDPVRMAGREAEARAAVLQADACSGDHDA